MKCKLCDSNAAVYAQGECHGFNGRPAIQRTTYYFCDGCKNTDPASALIDAFDSARLGPLDGSANDPTGAAA